MTNRFTCQHTLAGLMLMVLMTTLAPGQLVPGVIDVADLQDAALLALGQSAGDQLRVLATGDFNGDGVSDILLGTPNGLVSDSPRVNVGIAYIIFGSPNGITARDFGDPNGRQQDVAFFGAEAGDRFGLSAASGDLNGDGIDDLIISAPQASGPGDSRPRAGEVYIFFGSRDRVTGTVRDAAGQLGQEPDITIFGEEMNDTLGASVALGDVNGDGKMDLIMGAPGTFGPENTRAAAGSVYIIFGGPRLKARGVIDLADPVAGADVVIHGADPLDMVGFAVKTGDLNHDGIDDLVFSAPTASGPANLRRNAGEVYVLFGRHDLANQRVRDIASVFGPGANLTIFGRNPGDGLGGSLAIGDVSGDGVKDLVIGAFRAAGPDRTRPGAGEVYVILGSRQLRFEGTRDIAALVGRAADLTIFGARSASAQDTQPDQLGFSLSVGKFSGDKVDDLIIGAPGANGPDNQRVNAGEVYIVFGGPRLFDGLPRDIAGVVGRPADLTLVGPTAGGNFGATIAVADIDGDRANDLIVAAPFAGGPNNVRPGSGEALVISGK